jgi:hypothetical protein
MTRFAAVVCAPLSAAVEARHRLLLENVAYDGGGFEKFINQLPA